MSFKIVDQAKPRLNRSELAVPGSNPSLFEKAAKSNVDVIFLDLEDVLHLMKKNKREKNKLRFNDVSGIIKRCQCEKWDTHYMYRDVVDLIESAINLIL